MSSDNVVRKESESQSLATYQRLGAKKLARALIRGDVPDAVVRALPAQSIYMAMQAHGMESATELLDLLSSDKYSVLLDFELWRGDRIEEERFWHWLEVIDEDSSLEPLHRFLMALDRNVLATMICRHVQVIQLEDSSDAPPAPMWYTPDQGFTWINITLENPSQHRLLGRVLAYLFQANAQLFYQLLAVPGGTTASELEEDAYKERERRLNDEGIPDHETAWGIHQPLRPDQLDSVAPERNTVGATATPVLFEGGERDLLREIVGQLDQAGIEELESYLALATNAALSVYDVALYEYDEVSFLVEQIKGALSLGIESACQRFEASPETVYSRFGPRMLYQVGLHHLRELRAKSERITEESARDREPEMKTLLVLEASRKYFPHTFAFLFGEELLEDTEPKRHAIASFTDIQAVEQLIQKSFH